MHLAPGGGYRIDGLPAIGGGSGGTITLAMRARSGKAGSGAPGRDVLLSLSEDIGQSGSAVGIGFQVGASTVWEAAFSRASWRNNFSQAPAHAFGHKYSGIYAADPDRTYWQSDRFMTACFENIGGGQIRRDSWAWLYGRDGRPAPMDLGRRGDIWTGGGTPPNDQLLVHNRLSLGPFGHGADATNTATHGILWAGAWGRRLRAEEEEILRDFGPAILLRPARRVALRAERRISVSMAAAVAGAGTVLGRLRRWRSLTATPAVSAGATGRLRRDRAMTGGCTVQAVLSARAVIAAGAGVAPATALQGRRVQNVTVTGRREDRTVLNAGRKG